MYQRNGVDLHAQEGLNEIRPHCILSYQEWLKIKTSTATSFSFLQSRYHNETVVVTKCDNVSVSIKA